MLTQNIHHCFEKLFYIENNFIQTGIYSLVDVEDISPWEARLFAHGLFAQKMKKNKKRKKPNLN